MVYLLLFRTEHGEEQTNSWQIQIPAYSNGTRSNSFHQYSSVISDLQTLQSYNVISIKTRRGKTPRGSGTVPPRRPYPHHTGRPSSKRWRIASRMFSTTRRRDVFQISAGSRSRAPGESRHWFRRRQVYTALSLTRRTGSLLLQPVSDTQMILLTPTAASPFLCFCSHSLELAASLLSQHSFLWISSNFLETP